MRRIVSVVAIITVFVCFMASAAVAGEVLDRLLNSMFLDAYNGDADQDHFKTLTADTPLGQSFTTGPNVAEISRIAVAICGWHDSWTEGESVIMTLWDSPAKKEKLSEFEMKYEWKSWERNVVMFPINAKAEPNTSYYFELTSKGGDGEIVGIYYGQGYKGGCAYEGGRQVKDNIWFQIHARRPFDKDAVYSDRFSRWNLDYPGLERVKAAVEKKDWDTAVKELVAYYETARPDIIDPNLPKPEYDPSYDTTDADLACEMKILDKDGNVIELGPNWNHYRTWPTRGGVGLTRTGIMKYFRYPYMKTADEKYAKAFNDMVINMINDQPSPLRGGVIPEGTTSWSANPGGGMYGGSMWNGLAIGARMNLMWYFYSGLHYSPNFTLDARAALIFNMVDMAEVLSIMNSGGNWETQMSTALYELADRHPELKQSKEWFNQGVSTLWSNLWECCYADGVTQEPTSNYNNLMVNRFSRTLQRCRELGIEVDQKYVDRIEKAIEYIMFATRPDGMMRASGDSWGPTDGREYLQRGYDLYGREDFLYVATDGKEGRVPLATSAAFPIGGWFIMRSDWTPDALYLNLHNGLDMGHGHSDELSVTLFAYGNYLLVDPGCYVYGTAKNGEMATTKMHCTVSVDGADTIRHKGPSEWASMRSIDYYDGTNAGYSGVNDVFHNRKIAFVKPKDNLPGYWVFSDTVTGNGEHEVTSRYPFLPGEISLDATRSCHTNNAGGNLLITPLPGNDLAAEQYVYDLPLDDLTPAPGVKYTKKTKLPVTFATALIPYKGSKTPECDVKELGANAYHICNGLISDYVCFDNVDSDALSFDGEALVVRELDGRLKSAAWVNGKSLTYAGKEIASSEKPIKNLELLLNGDTLTVISSSVEPSLKVSTLGAKYVRVGYGAKKEVSNSVLEPYK